jgi:hypothetical protein
VSLPRLAAIVSSARISTLLAGSLSAPSRYCTGPAVLTNPPMPHTKVNLDVSGRPDCAADRINRFAVTTVLCGKRDGDVQDRGADSPIPVAVPTFRRHHMKGITSVFDAKAAADTAFRLNLHELLENGGNIRRGNA